MGLEITVETTDAYLTTTSAVKADLGITTSSDDTRLDALILRAGAWAETFVGYPLLLRRYRETVAGYGSRRLMLSRTPVRAVAGLFLGTDTGTADVVASSDFGVEAAPGFLVRDMGWEWSVTAIQDLVLRPQPGQEFQPWLVDYVAGYTFDGLSTSSALWSTAKGTTSTGRTLPYDIEAAVIAKAGRWYLGADTLVAKSVGDLRLQFGTGAGGRPVDPAADLLCAYRRSA